LTLSIYIDEYMALCLVLMISSFGLCLVSTLQSFEGLNNLQKLMGHYPFWCLETRAEKMLSTNMKLLFRFYQLPCFSLIYIMFLYVCAHVGKELEKRHATCNWHFHLLKSFLSINSCLWFAWIQMRTIREKLDIDFTLISLMFSGWPGLTRVTQDSIL
jgi:hypothetical protein